VVLASSFGAEAPPFAFFFPSFPIQNLVEER
jgi:hypothetical protein